MKNLTLENITKACKGTYHGDTSKLSQEVAGVVIDSRKVEKDYLFVAIDGENVNAHKFIPDTIEKGAMCVVSHEDLGETDYPYILVESTGQALLDIAKLYRDSFDVKVVGITGSVGKTSTKEMIASVLEQKYHVLKTAGNFNNEIGLPLTIFNIRDEHKIAVLEMGINHFGEMHRLAKMARPDICVITNIGLCHLENLIDRDGILKAKTEMFDFMQPNAKIILNGDDDKLITVTDVKGQTPMFFGLSTELDAFADNIHTHSLKGVSCTLHLGDNCIDTMIPIPGNHMVYNALAGALVGRELGLTAEEIKKGIESLTPVSGRNNMILTDSLLIIDDCYNANPVSTKASIDVLSGAETRKVAILGDMFELGEDEKELHRQVGVHASEKGIDLVICIGELSKATAAGAEELSAGNQVVHFDTKADFFTKMNELLHKDDTILVKASHGMEFPEIVTRLQELTLK